MGRNITRRLTAELFRSCWFVVDVFRIGGGVGKGSLIVFKRSSCLNWEWRRGWMISERIDGVRLIGRCL